MPKPTGKTALDILLEVMTEDAIAIREQHRRDVEATFRCMLTGKIMKNPVVHPNPIFEGRSFENGPELQEKLRNDPKYKLEPGQRLIPNPFLLDLMGRYKMMNPAPAPW
jgi:hypothetical protein